MSAGRTAAISAAGIVLVGFSMLSSSEAPGPALSALRWILLACGVIGLVGSLVQLAKER